MIFALAGLRYAREGHTLQVIALVDCSDSIYDRHAQNQALRLLADELRAPGLELGVVAFADNAGLERPLAPLPERKPATREEPATAADRSAPAHPPLPDLRKPGTDLHTGATDTGRALSFARGQFTADTPRALVLVGDGLDTAGRVDAAARALNGSGIDLLCWPAAMSARGDVHLAALQAPDRVPLGRHLVIDATVVAQRAVALKVRLGRREGDAILPVDALDMELTAPDDGDPALPIRKIVRLTDQPVDVGVAHYVVTIEGPEGRPLPGNYKQNDTLHTAVRVDGPSRWAVLARSSSTLAQWPTQAEAHDSPLGVETQLFTPGRFPENADAYRTFSGVLVDGFSAEELPNDGPALKALARAVENGLGLLALGGDRAFGAGLHPEEGAWEALLPVGFRPEEDRTRTILFVVDVSRSMDTSMQDKTVKLDFAQAQLGQVAAALRPADRVGLIAFSGQAAEVCPVTPDRARFVQALRGLKTENRTNFLAAFAQARGTLDADDAEEQLTILLSDGVPIPPIPDEELYATVRQLFPTPTNGRRRRTLHAFGIGLEDDRQGDGEARMKQMASLGGGAYFPDFPHLAREIRKALDQDRKDLYTRRTPFGVRARYPHPVLAAAGEPWPALSFRNRVKADSGAEVLARSVPLAGQEDRKGTRKPDPVVVLGRFGLGRTAVVPLSLEGAPGQAFLSPGTKWKGGRTLLAALLNWAEGDAAPDTAGWRIESRAYGQALHVDLFAFADQGTREAAVNDLNLSLHLEEATQPGNANAQVIEAALLPIAPGHYRAAFDAPTMGVYRAKVLDTPSGSTRIERFLTVPYAAEYKRFGADRVALQRLADAAGGRSRMINHPATDLAAWKKEVGRQRAWQPARPVLLLLAALLFLADVGARHLRRR